MTNRLSSGMAGNVNLYHQLLSRRNLASRSKLVAAIYEVFLEDGNDYLSQTKYASEMMSTLNYLAADVSLDFMDMDELRDIVEEAKSPKDRKPSPQEQADCSCTTCHQSRRRRAKHSHVSDGRRRNGSGRGRTTLYSRIPIGSQRPCMKRWIGLRGKCRSRLFGQATGVVCGMTFGTA